MRYNPGMPKKKSQPEEDSRGFDQQLSKLEEIVAALEEGGLELETAIERYKEGVALLKECREVLGGYRQQVEELGVSAEEAVRPYDQDPDLEDE